MLRRCVNEMGWTIIWLCDDNNPPVVRWIIAATVAHVGCRDVTRIG